MKQGRWPWRSSCALRAAAGPTVLFRLAAAGAPPRAEPLLAAGEASGVNPKPKT